MRTRHFVIGLSVLLALAACTRPDTNPVETRHGTSLPPTIASPELSAIDSLMWRQPDSALACLIPYFDTCCRDAKFCVSTTTTFNCHYANLLLAELLYKNDYAQTNRPALLLAVRYFDSLTLTLNDTPEPKRLIAGSSFREGGTLSLTRNDNIVFLNARAHYINGVGYYERDSIVPACAEYLKALELMESRFDEKDLVGKKARFMTYIYNRLTELFSAQFMMEPAIVCGEQALMFCMVEPTSPLGKSRILYQIGKQYDEMKELDKAKQYYNRALESMTNTDNLVYRDIVSSRTLCEYDAGAGMDRSLDELRRVVNQAETEEERLNRLLAIGAIFFEEDFYDSTIKYLEPVYKNIKSGSSQIQAAVYLRIIYDSLENNEKANEYVRFLTDHKEPEGEDKALVSKLEGLYKSYMNQKKDKQAEEARRRDVRKVVGVVIPMAIMVALAIIVFAKLRGKERLKEQQEEAREALEQAEKQYKQELIRQRAEVIETERQSHKIQQAALSGRLKQSNEELRKLKNQMRFQSSDMSKTDAMQAVSFAEEPICRLILERVKEGQFLSQMDCKIYKDYALDKNQLTALRSAADRHYKQFTKRIYEAHPELTRGDLDYCCLYLLGLTDADVAALMQRAYNTVNERNSKLRRIFKSEKAIGVTLQSLANEL